MPDAHDATALLRQTCHSIGAQVPLWTQGAGGNVSFKADDRLWIKASGQRLDAVGGAQSMAALPVAALRQRLQHLTAAPASEAEVHYAEALAQLRDAHAGQPSMESGMHAVLPARCVAHFHALSGVLMGHHEAARPGVLAAFFAPRGVKAAYVPATLPGLQLACALMPHAAAEVIVLGNHGVVLQGETPDALLAAWSGHEQAFCHAFGYPALAAYLAGTQTPPRTGAAPWRLYFPDTAVFADRLRALLHPAAPPQGPSNATPPLYALRPEAWDKDRNTAELWWAQSLLYALCPDLAGLPASQATAVVGLPSESWRRQVVAPNTVSDARRG
jgi:ribulose-5-phosphate 4-epimerase/fuculose-1-phosphate aldolase